MTLSAIVAMGRNREIGYQNQLLWQLKGDLPRFKKITLGSPIIMGRKTFESIGKPLPGRKNIVLSRSVQEISGACLVRTKEQVFSEIQDSSEAFVIGGAEIYRLFLPEINKIYFTLVEDAPQADAFFPEFNWDDFQVEQKEMVEHHPPFSYITVTRIH